MPRLPQVPASLCQSAAWADPPGRIGLVFDTGTAVIEALRAGRDATGADASPLALWVAGAHTWRPEPAQAEQLP